MKRILMTAMVFATLTSTALAGGFGIRCDATASPCNIEQNGVALKVTTLECGTPKHISLSGRAEGIVNGKRTSIPLKITKNGHAGVYDVTAQWPARGHWVLVFSASHYGNRQSLIVEMGPDGGFVPVSDRNPASGFFKIARTDVVSEKATQNRIDTILKG